MYRSLTVLLGLLLLSFTACSGDGEEKVLTILYWQAPSLPGPYLSGGYKDRDAGAITLEPLAYYSPEGELVPALAAEIPTIENGGISPDLRSITWTLKEGLRWSDGSDVTADDVSSRGAIAWTKRRGARLPTRSMASLPWRRSTLAPSRLPSMHPRRIRTTPS